MLHRHSLPSWDYRMTLPTSRTTKVTAALGEEYTEDSIREIQAHLCNKYGDSRLLLRPQRGAIGEPPALELTNDLV